MIQREALLKNKINPFLNPNSPILLLVIDFVLFRFVSFHCDLSPNFTLCLQDEMGEMG